MISLVNASPPDLPALIYGKVAYSSGDPASNVLVTANWKEGSSITKTSEKGEYIFLEKNIGLADPVTISSQGSSITLEPQLGIINKAPDMVIGDTGFFPKIFNSVVSFFIPESGGKIQEATKNKTSLENQGSKDKNTEEQTGERLDKEEDTTEKQTRASEEINEPQEKSEDKELEKDSEVSDSENLENKDTKEGYTGDNLSPVLGYIDEKIYVCEGESLYYPFNVTNPDLDTVTINITPEGFFKISPDSIDCRKTISARFYTNELGKEQIGEYKETIVVSDGELIDTKAITIGIIEINNPPVLEKLGIQTISLQEEKRFCYNLSAKDKESELSFTLDFKKGKNIFNITEDGEIDIILDNSSIGVYNTEICVVDKGIEKISPNIGICNQDGKPASICQNFSLTVTNENKKPDFDSYYPNNLEITLKENRDIQFNITLHDPDGTSPEVYWYFDNRLIESDSGFNGISHMFNQQFSCGSNHTIKAEITDGSLNNSLEWKIISEECEKKEISLLRVIEGYIKIPSFLKKILTLKIILLSIIIPITSFILLKIFKIFNLIKELKK